MRTGLPEDHTKIEDVPLQSILILAALLSVCVYEVVSSLKLNDYGWAVGFAVVGGAVASALHRSLQLRFYKRYGYPEKRQ